MNLIQTINKQNIDNCLEKHNVVVCKLRNSRVKAKQMAILEMLFGMSDCNIMFISNGPLGDVKGIFSVLIPHEKLNEFSEKLYGVGYCETFYILDFNDIDKKNSTDIISINDLIWKGKPFAVELLYKQDKSVFNAQMPNNRLFKIISQGTPAAGKIASGFPQ